MSTPSTAVATHPTQHQYYSHHQNFQPTSLGNYSINSPLNGYSRLANSHPTAYPPPRHDSGDVRTANYSSKPSHDIGPLTASSNSLAAMQNTARSKRKPDWAEFYKNGLPKEVIVIDDEDDSPAPSASAARAGAANTNRVANGASRHADKKRKTGQTTAYDPVYQQHTSYSTTQTPYAENSSSHNTASTDRTTSAINTTAPTSLGSQVSNGTYKAPPVDEGMVGQKRKRATRQAQDEGAKEPKRRQLERPEDPYHNYVPPPNPPVKAKDVYVQVVHDVRLQPPHTFKKPTEHLHLLQRSHLKDQKCDDDDGHFIVTPEAELTDRCKFRYVTIFTNSLLTLADSIIKLLGQGTFGKVVEAYDKRKRNKCAIKVIRSVQKYRDASRIELRVLSTLASNDKGNRNKCIHLRDCFDFRNHICIVTDLYGQSVFDFLKSNAFTPFPSTHIQEFARQLLTSVACEFTDCLQLQGSTLTACSPP